MLQKIVFLIFSAITLGSGLLVVTQRNLIRAAFCLMAALLGVAGLFAVMEASFLAMVQVFVYAGGIAILIVFAVMLTRRAMDPDTPQMNTQWGASVGLVLMLFILLALVLWPDPITTPEITSPKLTLRGGRLNLQLHINEITLGGVPWPESEEDVDPDALATLGEALVDSEGYVVPFEAASVLLLVAMVGAAYIAFPSREEPQAEPEPVGADLATEPGEEE